MVIEAAPLAEFESVTDAARRAVVVTRDTIATPSVHVS